MKNIALVAGGYSAEYVISVNSAGVIEKNIDPERFSVFTIMISGNSWEYFRKDGSRGEVDKNDFSILWGGEKITFDCALITIHGTPGEDGKLQGYLDMMRVPYTTSGQLASSVTFNKHFCNTLAASWGMHVARSVKFFSGNNPSEADILAKVTLPVFIKPNKGGSSLGTTFVKNAKDLLPAVKSCLEHDDEVFIEEFIDGIELTCGVYRRKGEVIALPVTEIVSKTKARFFDYEAKYTKGAADEITPARVSAEITTLVQNTTVFLYEKFELRGICRLDYIYSNDKLYFLEANITPGMSDRSIVPQQAEYVGISLRQLFTEVLEEAMGKG